MIRSIYFLTLSVLFFCSQVQGVSVIDAEQLKQLKSEGIVVVDIRTPQEYNQGHIPGVTHIDFRGNDFLANMDQFDKSKPIIIHCASGGRSATASSQLLKAGFTTIYDYSGGFSDWKQRGEEIE